MFSPVKILFSAVFLQIIKSFLKTFRTENVQHSKLFFFAISGSFWDFLKSSAWLSAILYIFRGNCVATYFLTLQFFESCTNFYLSAENVMTSGFLSKEIAIIFIRSLCLTNIPFNVLKVQLPVTFSGKFKFLHFPLVNAITPTTVTHSPGWLGQHSSTSTLLPSHFVPPFWGRGLVQFRVLRRYFGERSPSVREPLQGSQFPQCDQRPFTVCQKQSSCCW